MQSVWARSKAFIFYKGKPFPLPIWVYSFTSPSYLLHFLHQVQRGWSFVGHLPFGSNNTGSSNKTTSSKLGPKYLPMGTYHLGMLPLGTEGSACQALEHSYPLTPRHASNAPATILLLPQQCPRLLYFQCWKIPVGSKMSIPTHLWSLAGNPYIWGRHQVGRVMLLTLPRKAFIDGWRGP